MKRKVGEEYYFVQMKNGSMIFDPVISEYSKYLHQTTIGIGSISAYMTSIHRFWLYALYFPSSPQETFFNYVATYKRAMKKGFAIREKRKNDITGIVFEHNIFTSKALSPTTINKELSAIEGYFSYLSDPKVNPFFEKLSQVPFDLYYDRIDEQYMRHREASGKNIGYTLKSKGLMRLAIAKKVSVLKSLRSSRRKDGGKKRSSSKAFPIQAFDQLLKVAKPRDRLLYLLCGAAGARIGQALSLTTWDLDITNQRVYLPDPMSEEAPCNRDGSVFLNQDGRKSLLWEKYKINVEQSPHNLIRHKGFIPAQSDPDRALHFFLPRYREMFFDTLEEVLGSNLPEFSMLSPHPFVFQTSTGKRHLPTGAYDILGRNTKKIKSSLPKTFFKNQINAFHGLRHMYGSMMANIAILLESRLPSINKKRGLDLAPISLYRSWKVFTARKMGHTSIASVETYFKSDANIENIIMEEVQTQEEFFDSFLIEKAKSITLEPEAA